MDLTLYVADEDGQINLDGVAPPGTHYTAARNENTGVVRLTPVKVNTTAAKSIAQVVEPSEAHPQTGETPWDE